MTSHFSVFPISSEQGGVIINLELTQSANRS